MTSPGNALHAAIDEALLKQLIERFYARVRADDMIGPLFNEAVDDWANISIDSSRSGQA